MFFCCSHGQFIGMRSYKMNIVFKVFFLGIFSSCFLSASEQPVGGFIRHDKVFDPKRRSTINVCTFEDLNHPGVVIKKECSDEDLKKLLFQEQEKEVRPERMFSQPGGVQEPFVKTSSVLQSQLHNWDMPQSDDPYRSFTKVHEAKAIYEGLEFGEESVEIAKLRKEIERQDELLDKYENDLAVFEEQLTRPMSVEGKKRIKEEKRETERLIYELSRVRIKTGRRFIKLRDKEAAEIDDDDDDDEVIKMKREEGASIALQIGEEKAAREALGLGKFKVLFKGKDARRRRAVSKQTESFLDEQLAKIQREILELEATQEEFAQRETERKKIRDKEREEEIDREQEKALEEMKKMVAAMRLKDDLRQQRPVGPIPQLPTQFSQYPYHAPPAYQSVPPQQSQQRFQQPGAYPLLPQQPGLPQQPSQVQQPVAFQTQQQPSQSFQQPTQIQRQPVGQESEGVDESGSMGVDTENWQPGAEVPKGF